MTDFLRLVLYCVSLKLENDCTCCGALASALVASENLSWFSVSAHLANATNRPYTVLTAIFRETWVSQL